LVTGVRLCFWFLADRLQPDALSYSPAGLARYRRPRPENETALRNRPGAFRPSLTQVIIGNDSCLTGCRDTAVRPGGAQSLAALDKKPGQDRIAPALALVACLLAVSPQANSIAEQPGDRGPLNWRLACRLASYGKYQDAAWNHLSSIGVHHVFLSVPEPDEIAAVQQPGS